MKHKLKDFAGPILILSSLWLGAYAVSRFEGQWPAFPAFITALGGMLWGAVLVFSEETK